ncbi:hypothetical protein LDG_8515 [Legionella drancourtii LLAP12]|uniref:Uncharacterized protein n=1 Tax=Legionella drancourtii LLAP12 TaxID=658187 RepID=G9ET84_9GAMM|nr:hypothetical protein LDG_8515 [Legionella drancourtii LLAP12]
MDHKVSPREAPLMLPEWSGMSDIEKHVTHDIVLEITALASRA